MEKYELYKITNIITDKIYIGYTKIGILNRLHKHYLNASFGIDTKFYRAIRKYGIENFKIQSIIDSYNHKEIQNLEKKWIEKLDTYKNGYNSTIGGDGGPVCKGLCSDDYDKWIEKLSKNTSGKNNPRFSGYSDEDIIDFAYQCYIENNNKWIPIKWKNDYCKKFNIPIHYSKFRFGGKGYNGLLEELVTRCKNSGISISVSDLTYKKTKDHNIKLSESIKGRKWYHNEFLRESKQIHPEKATAGWELGRKKY